VHNFIEIFKGYFALLPQIKQLKRLHQFLIIGAIHHDINVAKVLIQRDVAFVVAVHD
jgi:hypothetical protein